MPQLGQRVTPATPHPSRLCPGGEGRSLDTGRGKNAARCELSEQHLLLREGPSHPPRGGPHCPLPGGSWDPSRGSGSTSEACSWVGAFPSVDRSRFLFHCPCRGPGETRSHAGRWGMTRAKPHSSWREGSLLPGTDAPGTSQTQPLSTGPGSQNAGRVSRSGRQHPRPHHPPPRPIC